MAQPVITVGKSRDVSYILFDQNNNPNPVGPDGQPLDFLAGTQMWWVGEPVTAVATLHATAFDPSAVTLTPSADGKTCNVAANTAGVTAVLYLKGDRGDGVFVQGGSLFETASEAGPVPVIAGVMLQWGPELEAAPK